MVTGSHNPPDYNGLKMVIAGDTLSATTSRRLRARIEAGALAHGRRHAIAPPTSAPAYLDRIAGDVKLARPMKIAVDCGNGVAGAFAPTLFRRLGCERHRAVLRVDGHFPNHHPDPSQPENLRDLIARLARRRQRAGPRLRRRRRPPGRGHQGRRHVIYRRPAADAVRRRHADAPVRARRSSTTSSRRAISSRGSSSTAASRCCGRPDIR